MENVFNNIDKEDNIFDIFKEYNPSFEEKHNPLSPFIEKNDKKDKNIFENPEIIIDNNQNFSNAETNDTNKFIKKKRKINNNSKSNKSNNKKSKKSKFLDNKKRKYSTDNLPRKIKTAVFDLIMKFYNKKIKDAYNDKIYFGAYSKIILDLNPKHINNKNNLLNKTMKDVFSNDISTKFNNYLPSHNKDIINGILNEEDKEKREQFNKLFNIIFIECIQHLRGDKIIEGLEGLENYYKNYINEEMKYLDESEDAKKYKNKFFEIFKKIENYFNNKKERKNK